jgi:hypothetical protein
LKKNDIAACDEEEDSYVETRHEKQNSKSKQRVQQQAFPLPGKHHVCYQGKRKTWYHQTRKEREKRGEKPTTSLQVAPLVSMKPYS